MSVPNIIDLIETNPEISGGQPRISGSRFTVKQIVIWHEYKGMSVDEIAFIYEIKPGSIHAALAYYFEHREEIQQSIHAENSLVEELKKQYPSKIQRTYA